MAPFIKNVLKRINKSTQALAEINTRILLTVVFFLIITPIGLLFRLFGKSLLAAHHPETLWTKRPLESDPGKPF